MTRRTTDNSGVVVLVILVIAAVYWFGRFDDSPSDVKPFTESDEISVGRQEAIDEHWDEIREFLEGTESIEACSPNGSCYSVDADISRGSIDRIRFTSGRYLIFDAEIEEDGSASDDDVEGEEWNFEIDMNSSIVDEAVTEWADSTGHHVVT